MGVEIWICRARAGKASYSVERREWNTGLFGGATPLAPLSAHMVS